MFLEPSLNASFLWIRSGSAGRMALLPLACPVSLQLAVYPAEGAHYVRHLDNDKHDPATHAGPPGQVCTHCIMPNATCHMPRVT
jgi:hypothetical protein